MKKSRMSLACMVHKRLMAGKSINQSQNWHNHVITYWNLTTASRDPWDETGHRMDHLYRCNESILKGTANRWQEDEKSEVDMGRIWNWLGDPKC